MTNDPLRLRDDPGALPELLEVLTSIDQPVDLPESTFERVEVALAALGLPVLGVVSGIVTTIQTSAGTGSAGAAAAAAQGTAVAHGTASMATLTAPLAASSGGAGTAVSAAASAGVSAAASAAASGTAGAAASAAHGILGASIIAKLAVVSAVAVGGPALWVASGGGERFSEPPRQESSIVGASAPSSASRTTAGHPRAMPRSSRDALGPKPVATIDLESWDTSAAPLDTSSTDRPGTDQGDTHQRGGPPVAAGGSPERSAVSNRARVASAAGLAAEARLLESVRAALETSPETARALLKRYDARYPQGQLKHEAQLLRSRLATVEGRSGGLVP